ncbi:pyrin-like isoform X3 [Alligator sinensis]|uniref:Pyrin-like isoform X3 n=1 Tax=Alligator sinensis TaxID=38654 RepID=A0A3Q0FPN4_ALLSI|nr:pyrin-like isoform X3 [Alligator sinensis]XP_025049243.1 pyrin-like isoform X3 [Alligator sinensis]
MSPCDGFLHFQNLEILLYLNKDLSCSFQEAPQEHLACLRKGREESKVQRERQGEELLKQTETERQKIIAECKELRGFLEEKEQFLLSRLEELDRDIVKRKDESVFKLSEEICHIDKLLSEKGGESEPMDQTDQSVASTVTSTSRSCSEQNSNCSVLHNNMDSTNPDGISEENQMLLNALEMSDQRMEALDNAEMLLLNTMQAMMGLLQRHQCRVTASHASLYHSMGLELESEIRNAVADIEADRALWINLQSNDREVWAHVSSSDWWERIVLSIWDDQQWLESFRMSRDTFLHIVSLLSPHIERQDTVKRHAVTPEKRVAVAIMKLATPTSLRFIGN